MHVEDELDRLMKLVGDPGKTPKSDEFCKSCGKPKEQALAGLLCDGRTYRNVTAKMLDKRGYLLEQYR